jgi:hypothetical protein
MTITHVQSVQSPSVVASQGPQHGLLEPDAAQLRNFISAVFKYATPGTFVSLRAFEEGRQDRPPFRIDPVAVGQTLEPLIERAVKIACVSAQVSSRIVFAPPVATFNSPRSAKESDLADGLVLSVECDVQPYAARAMLERILGRATVIVRSGSEWTDPGTGEVQPKLHLHWRLAVPARGEALRDLKRARELACRIAGADGTTITVVHPMRWPGSWHRKGAPVLRRMEACNPDIEIDLGDALARLREARPQDKAAAPNGGEDHEPREGGQWATLLREILTSESYHEPLTRLAAKLLGSGMNDGAAVKYLRGLMMNVAGPRDARWQQRYDYCARAVRTARDKFGAIPGAAAADSKASCNGKPRSRCRAACCRCGPSIPVCCRPQLLHGSRTLPTACSARPTMWVFPRWRRWVR